MHGRACSVFENVRNENFGRVKAESIDRIEVARIRKGEFYFVTVELKKIPIVLSRRVFFRACVCTTSEVPRTVGRVKF